MSRLTQPEIIQAYLEKEVDEREDHRLKQQQCVELIAQCMHTFGIHQDVIEEKNAKIDQLLEELFPLLEIT